MSTTIHIAFAQIPDPRAQNHTYPLIQILFITICAMLAGADDFDEVVDWAQLHRDFLLEFLPELGPIPTPITFRRVFAALDPFALELGFARWAQLQVPKPKNARQRRMLAADGKSLRGSFTDSERQDMFHSVSLMCHETGMMVALGGSTGRGHEVADVRELLEVVNLKDTLITLDALHTCSETAELIKDEGGDYLMALKGNCPARLAEVELLFEDAMNTGDDLGGMSREETDKGHGRVEVRRAWAAELGDWFGEPGQFKGAKSVMRLERERHIGEESSAEVSYYLSSVPAKEFEWLFKAARSHWSIENRGHWVLDVILKEDASRLREGATARNVGVMRRITLNILRADKSQSCSLKRKRWRAGLDTKILRRLLKPLIRDIPFIRS